jgi:hypothetical protein
VYYPLQIKQAYDFTLYAPGVLGLGFQNAVVMAIMDYDTAKLTQDIIPLHIQAYPSLPVGTPRNAKDLTYVKIRTSLNEIRILAMDWISAAPTLVTSQTLKVTVSQTSIGDIALIRDLLVANGFTSILIEVI